MPIKEEMFNAPSVVSDFAHADTAVGMARTPGPDEQIELPSDFRSLFYDSHADHLQVRVTKSNGDEQV